MRAEKVIYMQTFPTGNFSNQKLGVEIILEPGEGVEECFKAAKTAVEAAFRAMNPSPTPSITDFNTGMQGIPEPPKVINLEAERVAIQIENSTSVQELRSYGDKAVIHGLMDIYEKKLAELTK